MKTTWLLAEKEAASDETLVVVDILVRDGDDVVEYEAIFELEGSKSVFDIRAPHAGVLHIYVKPGDIVVIGTPIAALTDKSAPRPDVKDMLNIDPGSDATAPNPESGRFSKKALDALKMLGLESQGFLPGKSFVTLNDVENETADSSRRPSPLQRERVAFIGGGYGALLAHEVLLSHHGMLLVGLFDDGENLLEDLGVLRLGNVDKDLIERLYLEKQFDKLFIAIQSNQRVRRELSSWTQEKSIPLAKLLHQNARISETAKVAEGALVMDGGRIAQNAVIDRNVFISGMVNIDHHVRVGQNTTFGPGVFLSGGVRVGADCRFASGIVVESHLSIGAESTISSGSVIKFDIPQASYVKTISNIEVRDSTQQSASPGGAK